MPKRLNTLGTNSMSKAVYYLATGSSYLHYLVPSVWSLRRYWDGEITIYAWPDSSEVAHEIAKDDRLGVKVKDWKPTYRKRNATFEFKPIMMQDINADVGLFIDSDTLVCGSVEPLFPMAEQYGFVATQFCGWTTQQKFIKGRINNLRKYPEIPQDSLDSVLAYEWPSINTGIFACKPSSPVLPVWYKWTVAARSSFIPDETTLHAAMPMFWPKDEMRVIMEDGKYNSSPKYRSKKLTDEEVVIWHFHRHSCSRPDTVNGVKMDGNKSQKGWELWWPVYVRCLRENIGNIQSWRYNVNNKWIKAIENVTGDLCL